MVLFDLYYSFTQSHSGHTFISTLTELKQSMVKIRIKVKVSVIEADYNELTDFHETGNDQANGQYVAQRDD